MGWNPRKWESSLKSSLQETCSELKGKAFWFQTPAMKNPLPVWSLLVVFPCVDSKKAIWNCSSFAGTFWYLHCALKSISPWTWCSSGPHIESSVWVQSCSYIEIQDPEDYQGFIPFLCKDNIPSLLFSTIPPFTTLAANHCLLAFLLPSPSSTSNGVAIYHSAANKVAAISLLFYVVYTSEIHHLLAGSLRNTSSVRTHLFSSLLPEEVTGHI